jgi:hypothetical protein
MLLLLLILLVFAFSVKGAPIQLGVPIFSPDLQGAPTFDHALDDARRAGMSVVQIRADWPRIQPDAKTWNFVWLDALVAKAQARGLTVVLVFGPAPSWAVSYLREPTPEELTRARPDVPAYERYVTEVAKRYAGRVRYYQLWERPVVTNLLATAADAHKLYRAAARAVHAVDPALLAVAAEPGDVQLGWIHAYLHGARGIERPDILLLSAATDRSSPEALARRLDMLRDRVLSEPAPILWASVTAATEQEWCWSAAASLLLQDVSTLLLQPTAAYRDICAKPTFLGELQSLATLRGLEYLGWQRVGPALAGVFGTDERQCAVILPDDFLTAGAALRLIACMEPVDDGIAVPSQRVEVRRLSGTAQHIDVDEEVEFTLSPRPVILNSVLLSPTAGTPPRRSSPMTCSDVSLDPTGADRAAIRPLRNLPGGQYGEEKYQGRVEILRTVRDEQPWIHLDVPDDFLFFNIERRPVEVTVCVRGVKVAEKTGFLLYYDAIGGMVNSAWQWIDVGPFKKLSYTFRLDDALFAGSEGYDLRLDMGGSEENIRLIDVTVRKPAPAPATGHPLVPAGQTTIIEEEPPVLEEKPPAHEEEIPTLLPTIPAGPAMIIEDIY